MKRKIYPIAQAELMQWPTKRLLARLQRLHECEEYVELSDRSEPQNDGSIEYKQSAAWNEEYYKLKAILVKREHIQR